MGPRRAGLAFTLGSVMTFAIVATTTAQAPRGPDDVVVPPARSHPTVAKSDQHRLVGKVVDVDPARGVIKLATEDEGVLDVPAPAMTVKAVRVGETVSVPRPASRYPSASPR
jgi:hypothetical protein